MKDQIIPSFFDDPIRSITAKVRSLIRRRQSGMDQAPPLDKTTELGTQASVAPRTSEQARLYIERYDRRSVITDIHKMLADNPLLAEAASVFVDTAVSKGFSVNVEKTAARGVAGGNQNKAQRIINRLIKESDMRKKVPSWARMLMSEGDLFLQNVEYNGELINVKRMPAVTMERNSDVREAFPDVMDAFHMIDVSTNENLATFALWQITHSRWNFIDGERYGSSQYLQLRRMSKIFLGMINDMAVRRRTRGPQRFFHKVGTELKPGGKAQVEEYMALNGFTDMDKRGELQQTTDFFGNGVTDVTAIRGDSRLGDIEDVQFQLNVLFPRTGMAKGLIGFGENVNRDVLDEQIQMLHTRQDLLIDVLEWDIIRPSIDLALMMQGVNPDSIVYDVTFEERLTEAAKLAKVELYVELYEVGLLTDEQVITRIAPYINVKDVKGHVTDLIKWREEKRQKAMQEMGISDDDESIAGRRSANGNQGRSKVARFGQKAS